ncbi:MAG: hypothetical protein Q7K39_01565 [Candidatus Magasanikbacteria bacterium]|nr:hypothetical protein [Candidatus Magasanikbacteria bacterium]
MGEGITRRDFIGLIGAAVISGAGEKEACGQEFKDQSLEIQNLIRQLDFDKRHEKINFQEAKRELPPKLKNLVQEIIALQKSIPAIVAAGRIPDARDHQRVWAACQTILPNLPAYSEPAFYQTFFTEIPRRLAAFGVATVIRTDRIKDDRDTIVSELPRAGFYHVNKITSDTVMFEGQPRERSVLFVNSLAIDQPDTNTRLLHFAAFTDSGNIIIDEPALAAEHGAERQMAVANREYLNMITDDFIMGHIADKQGADQDKWADIGASQRRHRRYLLRGNFNQLDNIISHETGHLMHAFEPDFREREQPPFMKTSAEVTKYAQLSARRSEARGAIGNLLFAKDKLGALNDLLYVPKPEDAANVDDLGHQMAGAQLRELAAEELVQEADYYGIKISANTPVTPRNQALFQIVEISGDANKVEHLGRKLLERVRHGQEFKSIVVSKARLPFTKQARTADAGAGKQNLHIEESRDSCGKLGFAGIVAAVGAGVWALRSLGARKMAVRQAEATHRPKNNRRKKRKK